MNITKLVHSCLLVEHSDKKFLVDPGSYSWQSGLITDDALKNIDAVVVTHAHPDHLDQKFAETVNQNSPEAAWYGPQQVVDQLLSWGITGNTTSDNADVRFVESQHADLAPWFPEQPDHTSFVLFDDLLIGGDCHTLTQSYGARIFAGAINGGPWGAVIGFAKMIQLMEPRPEIVIPLHDWHWNDEARQGIYARMPDVMKSLNVTFIPLENGASKEI